MPASADAGSLTKTSPDKATPPGDVAQETWDTTPETGRRLMGCVFTTGCRPCPAADGATLCRTDCGHHGPLRPVSAKVSVILEKKSRSHPPVRLTDGEAISRVWLQSARTDCPAAREDRFMTAAPDRAPDGHAARRMPIRRSLVAVRRGAARAAGAPARARPSAAAIADRKPAVHITVFRRRDLPAIMFGQPAVRCRQRVRGRPENAAEAVEPPDGSVYICFNRLLRAVRSHTTRHRFAGKARVGLANVARCR
jgi:hypothetical protein